MHDALEVVAEWERRGAIDFRRRAIHIESGATKVIVEVCRDDPEGFCAAKEPNNGFVKMVRAGKRIGQLAPHGASGRLLRRCGLGVIGCGSGCHKWV